MPRAAATSSCWNYLSWRYELTREGVSGFVISSMICTTSASLLRVDALVALTPDGGGQVRKPRGSAVALVDFCVPRIAV